MKVNILDSCECIDPQGKLYIIPPPPPLNSFQAPSAQVFTPQAGAPFAQYPYQQPYGSHTGTQVYTLYCIYI